MGFPYERFMAMADDRRNSAPLGHVTLMARVRAEFDESPGMRLTEAQVCRLFHLDPGAGASILTALCEVGFLSKDPSGRFRKSA